jgi:hypothetical protein
VRREQGLDDALAHARIAAPETGGLEGEHHPHDRRRQRLADANGVRADQVRLQGVELALADARRGELAEAGIDAVHRRLAARRSRHDLGTGADRRARAGIELEADASGVDRLKLLEVELARREAQPRHQDSSIGSFRPCSRAQARAAS